MFHLQPRIHFEEIEIAGVVGKEFDGTRVEVTGGARGPDRGLAHAFRAGPGCAPTAARRFLNHLLMPPLHGTFAFAQMNHIAVPVAKT